MNSPSERMTDLRGPKLAALALALAAVFGLSLSVGLPEFGLRALFDALADVLSGRGLSEESRIVFLDLRLPRLCLAVVAGAALSLAGVGTQAVLCNPLVSPSVLGLSAGAAFGASLAVLFRALVREEGKSLLVVEHDLNLAARYADSLYVLKKGRMVASGPAAEILEPGLLREVYGIEAAPSAEGGLHIRGIAGAGGR